MIKDNLNTCWHCHVELEVIDEGMFDDKVKCPNCNMVIRDQLKQFGLANE